MVSYLWLAGAYLLGSVPCGVIIAKRFRGVDPRTAGSGNVGATNVARLCGARWGVLVLVCDALKGLAAVAVALWISDSQVLPSLCAVAAILGHRYSVFMRFTGGKAVATTVGVFIPLAFWQLVIAGALCILVIWRSGFVSLGSLTLVTVLPVAIAVSARWNVLPLALLAAAMVFYAHRENIRRLARGEENPWLTKKTAAKPENK
jgi:glycerol-3-phosphate acyltransferase PlsY